MKSVSKNNSGFTLIELMLAAGVMAMALSMLFGSLISISLMGEVAKDRTLASELLSGTLEFMRTLDYEEMLAFTPPTIDGLGERQVTVLECYSEDGTAHTLPMTGTLPTLPNPVEVRATIIWEDQRGRAYTASASAQYGR